MAKTKKSTDAKKSASKLAKDATGKVHLTFLLDETGSMSGNEEGVVTGVNEFLATFKKEKEADVRVWLSLFDAHPGEPRTRVKIDGKKVGEVEDMKISEYNPRGMTPLNDAILDTIEALNKKVKKGEKAFIVILTDGMENASETSAETVQEAVKKAEKKGWAFLYLGANQQAEVSATQLGLGKKGQAFNFTASKRGTSNALRTASVSNSAAFLSAAKSGDENQYLAAAASMYDKTGGVLPEDEEVEITS